MDTARGGAQRDIQRLFLEVADLSASQRSAHFDRLGVAPEIRAEVESLLRFDTAAGDSITNGIATAARGYLTGEAGPQAGSRCGVYELVRLLGRGGMGAVFLAHRFDGEVEQRVAIKFAHLPAGDPAARERFLRERQFLASLNHPGITRLLDAGHTAESQPYLVMEYVEGVPLDVYAMPLDLRSKLELFLQVTAALSYAHRNLVIHRDLKPSNILVDAAGQAKLLDFGIARMLDDASMAGVTGDRRLTPDYASPEQMLGAAHTTATDVYSLGALLYRLLTGRSPHQPGESTPDSAKPETAEDLIFHRSAPSPSRVNPAVPRDLDYVVGKALRKEPEERYAGVDAMAEDLRAFLESRPVRARTGDSWYRARKFLRRYWLPAAALASIIVVLAAGLLAASRERAIAQRRFLQLRQYAGQMLELDPELRELPGATAARRKVVAVTMAYLDGLGKEARDDRDLAMELANGYLQLAKVQGVPAYPNLGQFADADASLIKADRFVGGILRTDAGRPDALLLAAQISEGRMMLADVQRRDADVLAQAGLSGARLERLARDGRASTERMRVSVASWFNVGQAYMNQHRFEEAVRYARRGVSVAQSAQSPARATGAGMSMLAAALRQSGDLDGALASIAESRKLVETALFPGEVQKAGVLYTILLRQSQILWAEDSVSLDRIEEAREPAQRAFELMEQLAAGDPKDATSRGRVGSAAQQLGDVLRTADPRLALEVYDRGAARQREVPGSVKARVTEARLLALSSYPLRSLGRKREAAERLTAAFDLLRATKDYPAREIRLGSETADAFLARADWESEAGNGRAAIATCRELLDKVMASNPHPDTDLMQAAGLSRIYATLGRLYRRSGQEGDAVAMDALRTGLWGGWQARVPNSPFIGRQLSPAGSSR